MSGKGDKHNNGLKRREFLKIGATGFGVALTGCGPGAAPDDLPADEELFEEVTSTGRKPPTRRVPEVGELIDPRTVRAENWQEPWLWRPERWPDASLDLNLVRAQNPGLSPSPGNPGPSLFSFNGTSPGPTVRVRSDGVLKLRVRNTLGLNEQQTPVGPCPDPVDLTPDVEHQVCSLIEAQVRGGDPDNPRRCNPFDYPEQFLETIQPKSVPGWALRYHVNGLHCAHTTNLHTHGLHVFPNRNPDGTYSDDVHLRIIPQADWDARRASEDPNLHTLAKHEHVGQLDYKIQFAFERDGEPMHHPPGTHWYHPHSHGSTHDQVSSGMAGFLIVEGDVDDAINVAMTGDLHPDPELRTGSWDYRERLIFIQRVQVLSVDLDAGVKRRNLRAPPAVAINGIMEPGVIRLRPGAVERWRVLNGSVDGAGTKRFMVLDGQYVQRHNRIWRVISEGEGEDQTRSLEPVTDQEIEDAKLDLQQLSFDGITLVVEEDGKARHKIRDLSLQNAGTRNPFIAEERRGENEYETWYRGVEAVYENGDSLRRAYVRPNEVYLTNANRTDLFFKAPLDSAGRVFTIFAKEAHIHSDNFQRFLQVRSKDPNAGPRRDLFDTVVGYIHVDGDPVEGGDFDIQSLNEHLPEVPPLLQPIHADELSIPASEAAITGVEAGKKRCRTISYSGLGAADFPMIEVPEDFARAHPELENIVWATHNSTRVLLPALGQTMGINTDFDLHANPEPDAPHKFMPEDPKRSSVLVDTAEEWVLYNTSMMLWSHTDLEDYPQPGSWDEAHYLAYPLSRAEGQERHWGDAEFMISSKANDHPFHIHINPMWVLRIDVPDQTGELHNILPEPRWMDTVAIPRNGGRVVFRSRFDDFTGDWVNHCHVLVHEDNGMMQQVHCTDDPSKTNYRVRDSAAEHGMSGKEVDAIYPKPSPEIMYRQNLSFVDPNELGYQVFPGFELEIPEIDS
jgi:FtsP/CotA-like multicopper oxidase with cupredoxin domain